MFQLALPLPGATSLSAAPPLPLSNSFRPFGLTWEENGCLPGQIDQPHKTRAKAPRQHFSWMHSSLLSGHSRCLVNWCWGASQVALMVENQPADAGDKRDEGLIPGSRRSPGGRHGNLLQYSCLENPMERGAWWATVHRVAQSQTRLT